MTADQRLAHHSQGDPHFSRTSAQSGFQVSTSREFVVTRAAALYAAFHALPDH